MNTVFLLMAQYNGQAIIPIERVCADYFCHLPPEKMKLKVAKGEIDLPLIMIEGSQKAARGVHINDLADYIDRQTTKARTEHEKLMGRHVRDAS